MKLYESSFKVLITFDVFLKTSLKLRKLIYIEIVCNEYVASGLKAYYNEFPKKFKRTLLHALNMKINFCDNNSETTTDSEINRSTSC